MRSISIFICFFIYLCGCAPQSPERTLQAHVDSDTSNSIVNVKDTTKKESLQNDISASNEPSKINLYFQPYTNKLTGTLSTETFYGPPNYGDDPAHDSKENFYMLNLDESVNVLVHPGDENNPIHDFDTPTMGIKKMEIAFAGNDALLRPYINKKITLSGKLFGAVNAHHHTAVLIEVSVIVK